MGKWWTNVVQGLTGGKAPSPDGLAEVKWPEFELLLGEAFRLQGFLVTESAGEKLVLQKGEERFIVQCKHWRSPKVDAAAVRELFGVMAASGAAGGFVVSAGGFSADAASFAEHCQIRLIDGATLAGMLDKARQTLTMPPRIEPRLGTAKPQCPRCTRTMIQRVAEQGSNAGRPFWGCPAFPDCRGTLPI